MNQLEKSKVRVILVPCLCLRGLPFCCQVTNITLINLFDSLTKAELFGICEALNCHGNEHIGIVWCHSSSEQAGLVFYSF